MKRYRCIVSGKVQRVWYRKFVIDAARAAGFRGYIRNLPNGSVETVVDTPENELETFKEILKKGSPLSYVKEISYEEIPLDAPFHDFGVIR